MANEEQFTKSGLQIPKFREALRLFGRAFLLRCPNCGRGPVLKNWLTLRERCGTCGLRMQRGEHDYFVGSMFILFTLVGLFMYAVLVVALLVTRKTPWDLIENGLPLLALAAVFAFVPFSRLLWLAFDLALRPVNSEELRWHRETKDEWSTGR